VVTEEMVAMQLVDGETCKSLCGQAFEQEIWFRSGLIPYRPLTSSYDAWIYSWLGGSLAWPSHQKDRHVAGVRQPRPEGTINIMYALARPLNIVLPLHPSLGATAHACQ
jgi:hypothetical protein